MPNTTPAGKPTISMPAGRARRLRWRLLITAITLLGLVSLGPSPAGALPTSGPFDLTVNGSGYLTGDVLNGGAVFSDFNLQVPVMTLHFEPTPKNGAYTFAGPIRFDAVPYESRPTDLCLVGQLVTGEVTNGSYQPSTGTLSATVTVRLQRYPTPRPGASPKQAARCTGWPPGPYVFDKTLTATGFIRQGQFRLASVQIYPDGSIMTASFNALVP